MLNPGYCGTLEMLTLKCGYIIKNKYLFKKIIGSQLEYHTQNRNATMYFALSGPLQLSVDPV